MSGFFGDLIDSLSTPQALTSIGGALIGSNASQKAANTVSDANTRAAQMYADQQQAARDAFQKAATQGEGFIDQGTQDYSNTVSPLLTQSPIMLPQYRGLTTQQQLGEADLLREGQGALAASGLRGAGRAGLASLTDALQRYEAGARAGNDATNLQAMQTNQQSQNAARTGLANVQAAAGTAKANTAIGAGSQIGGSYQQQGNNAANLASSSGGAQAGAAISAGNNWSSALGSLAGTGYANSPNSGYFGAPLGVYGGSPTIGQNARGGV